MEQKRALAIHDISCFGKCSLTVALPILSAAGIETTVLPTAVLSTHTGGFKDFTYRDLTEDLGPIADHWRQLRIGFDAMYSGFLGSYEQIDIVSDIFGYFRTDDSLVLVDPVMADHGELYKVFTPDMVTGMTKLCGRADIIIPNMTEASFILGEPFKEGPYDRAGIEMMLKRLSKLGPKQVVITGVYFSPELLGAAGYDRDTGDVSYAFAPKIEGYYHGTGDIFGSALLSGLLNGMKLKSAMQLAVDFVCGSIERTKLAGTDLRYGVNFEAGIPKFVRDLGLDAEPKIVENR